MASRKTPDNAPPSTTKKPASSKRNTEILDQLQSIIGDLISKLVHVRLESAQMEANIRKEFHDRYVKMDQEMRSRYSADRCEAVDDLDNLVDSRVRLFKEYAFDDSESENDELWVPGSILKEKELECDSLRKELETVRQQSTTTEASNTATATAGQSDLNAEVELLKKQLHEKEREAKDLADLLDEAAVVFQKMQREIDEQNAKHEETKDHKETESKSVQFPSPTAVVPKNLSIDSGVRISSSTQTHYLPSPVRLIRDTKNIKRSFFKPIVPMNTHSSADVGTDHNTNLVPQNVRVAIPVDHPTSESNRPKKRSNRVSLAVMLVRKARKRRSAKNKFNTTVKLNRAYKLRMASSPKLWHDHKTGTTSNSKPTTPSVDG